MQMAVAMTVAPAMIFGFLAGLLSFRVKSRWCPVCGETLACPAHSPVTSGGMPRGQA